MVSYHYRAKQAIALANFKGPLGFRMIFTYHASIKIIFPKPTKKNHQLCFYISWCLETKFVEYVVLKT